MVKTFQEQESLEIPLSFDECYNLVLETIKEHFRLVSEQKKLGRIAGKGYMGWSYAPKITIQVIKVTDSSSKMNIQVTANGAGLLSPNTAKRDLDKFIELFSDNL